MVFMELRFRYDKKACLSKKEEIPCIGNATPERIRSDSTGKERNRACGEGESILFFLTQPPLLRQSYTAASKARFIEEPSFVQRWSRNGFAFHLASVGGGGMKKVVCLSRQLYEPYHT
jgi:hypothetical protein